MPASFQTILYALGQPGPGELRDAERIGWTEQKGIDAPNADQLQMFFTLLRRRVRLEKMPGAVANAIDLAQTLQVPNRNSYTGATLRYQVALRAAYPDCIQQAGWGFCGPASILYDFARRWPERYVHCVVDLHNNRRGELLTPAGGPEQIQADDNFESEYNAFEVMQGPADWLILHAMRRKAQEGLSPDIKLNLDEAGDPSQATTPEAMCSFLRKIGYRNVENHSLWRDALAVPLVSERWEAIRSSAAKTRQRALVVMLTNPWLSMTVMGKTADPWSKWRGAHRIGALSDLHWIAVSDVIAEDANVAITFTTYGKRFVKTYGRVDFQECFYGYVSATP